MTANVLETELDSGLKPCKNPECDNAYVEVEQDGDHLYWECGECGFTFDYQRIDAPQVHDDSCQVGIPEPVRRRASAGMEKALRQEASKVPVMLQIGKRPE